MAVKLNSAFEDFSKHVSTRSELVCSLKDFINEVIAMVDEANESCSSSDIQTLAKSVSEISESQRAVKRACDSAKKYAQHLVDFFTLEKKTAQKKRSFSNLKKEI